jgi:hypothetical protein
VNLERNFFRDGSFGARCAFLLWSSPFAWLHPRYDTGWGFSHSTRAQLQQLGVNSVFVFPGHSLCRWPPRHHKHRRGCLQFSQTWPKFQQLSHCVRPFWALYDLSLMIIWLRLFSLNVFWDFTFLVKVTRNSGRFST